MKRLSWLGLFALLVATWFGSAFLGKLAVGLQIRSAHAQVGGSFAGSPWGCARKASYDASTNGSTRIVTGAGQNMHICGFTIWAGGTTTVQFTQGSGTNCATGETAITPAFALTTQTGITDSSPFYRGLNVPIPISGVAQDICIKTSAGVAVQAILYYGIR